MSNRITKENYVKIRQIEKITLHGVYFQHGEDLLTFCR